MNEFEQDIVAALEALKRGGIILYPTDTVWGIGCDATNDAAVQKIYILKQREASKSMIVLITEEQEFLKYTAAPPPELFLFLESETRPTTVVLDGALGLAENLIAEDGSVALRFVQEPFCRHLIKRFGKPIVSTSANISGTETPQTFAAISDVIKNGVDYVVQHRQQETAMGQPSQIVRFSKEGTFTILRK